MDRLGAMRMFVEIVDRGSLSAASRHAQISLPVVVRTLAALEKRLGVRLLNRTTRRIHLTDAGADFYQRCKRIAADVEEAEQAASERRHTPAGTLIVNAPLLFGRMHVAPLVAAFLDKYPLLKIELTLSDRNVDIIEDGVDVAVRVGSLPDSSLGAVQLGQTQRVLVASSAYLGRMGKPKEPEDLQVNNCLRFTGLTPGRTWHFLRNGRDVGIPISGNVTSTSGDVVIEAALRGCGIAFVLSYQVMNYVADGKLRLLLQEFAPPPVPIHAVFAHPKLVSAKVRAFVDHLKNNFSALSFLPTEHGRHRAAPRRGVNHRSTTP